MMCMSVAPMNLRLPVIMPAVILPLEKGNNMKSVFSSAAKPKATVTKYIMASIGSSKLEDLKAMIATVVNLMNSSNMAQYKYL